MSEKEQIILAASGLAVFAEKNGVRQITATDDGQIIGQHFGGRQTTIRHAIPPDIFEQTVALAAKALARKHGTITPLRPETRFAGGHAYWTGTGAPQTVIQW